ncbi:hypothetical protein FDJ58_gp131 [Bacillus phage SIOphi]|uniref:Uncharacterized protein n=1 Tax=Bacillus phage SIOphi TaxID=1285382 RepID=R4JK98_9CAUD|nr:hypothetical protein FDJ58_gp131 [Bacillus phage SIOphi]AGK86939.1 hypothetical protein SIOphi_00655 [Bacillus phage SIOphi]
MTTCFIGFGVGLIFFFLLDRFASKDPIHFSGLFKKRDIPILAEEAASVRDKRVEKLKKKMPVKKIIKLADRAIREAAEDRDNYTIIRVPMEFTHKHHVQEACEILISRGYSVKFYRGLGFYTCNDWCIKIEF